MKNINPNIRIIGRYDGAHTHILCSGTIHNEEFKSSPTHLLAGQIGCKSCIAEMQHHSGLKTTDEFKVQLSNINDTITVIGEYDGAKAPLKVQCNKCGNIWTRDAHIFLMGIGCPFCYASKGERKIRIFLDQNNIDYIQQKSFSSLRGIGGFPLRYDFYIPKYNLLLEYQGEFHDGSAFKKSSRNYLDTQIEHDKRKREYALNNNYNFLEIWYYQYKRIDEILSFYFIENPVTTTV